MGSSMREAYQGYRLSCSAGPLPRTTHFHQNKNNPSLRALDPTEEMNRSADRNFRTINYGQSEQKRAETRLLFTLEEGLA